MKSSASDLENIWKFAEDMASSKDVNDRIYGAVVMKEMHAMVGKLIELNHTFFEPDKKQEVVEQLTILQQKIKDRIEII